MYLLHKYVKEGMSDNAAWDRACAFWYYTGPKPVDKTRSYKTVMRLAAEQIKQTPGQTLQQSVQQLPASTLSAVPVVRPKALVAKPSVSAGSSPARFPADSIAASVKAKRLAAQGAVSGSLLDHQNFTSSDVGFLPPPSSEVTVNTTEAGPAGSKRRPRLIRVRRREPSGSARVAADPESLFLPTSLDNLPVAGPVDPAARDLPDDSTLTEDLL